MASSRETIKMLCECFPERLGHLVCYKAPWVFKAVFEGFKIFLDAKTVSKVVFVYGDHSDGSETDVLMQKVIGPEWRVLTGAAQPVLKPNTSPGYNHAVFWPKVLARVEAIQKRELMNDGRPLASVASDEHL